VAEDFCCPARPFHEKDLQKYRRIWLNAPLNGFSKTLQKP
jgi:hypothetical protein